MHRRYYVYILCCSDGSYYTGISNDVERRVWEHNNDSDHTHYTYNRRPNVLVWSGDFKEVKDAIAFEKQVKGWSRKKKEALIQGDWQEIIRLSNAQKTLPESNTEKDPSAESDNDPSTNSG